MAPAIDLLPVIGRYDEKRLLESLLLLIIMGNLATQPTLLHDWVTQLNLLPKSSRMILASVLGLGLMSATLASDSRMALLEVSLFVLLVIGSVYIATCSRLLGSRFDSLISYTVLISAGVLLLTFAAALLAASTTSLPLLHQELFGNFSHIRFFSQLQSWTLALIVLPLILNEKPRRSYFTLLAIIACGWWLLALTTGTRGTLLGMLVAAIVVALTFGRHAKPWFKWQVLALCGAMALYVCLFILPTLISGSETNTVQDGGLHRSLTSPSGRFYLWEIAWLMIKDNPWLGAGPMHFACGINHAGFAAHPHNALLQIASEWGLPAALLVVILVVSGIIAWIRQGRRLLAQVPDHTGHLLLYPTLLASLTTGFTHALFSGIIIMPLSQLMLMLVGGWMLGFYAIKNCDTGQPRPSKHITLFWLIVLVLAALGLLQGVLPALADFGELLNLAQMPEQARLFAPRFWQQGLFCP